MNPVINKRKCPAVKQACTAILSCPNQAIFYVSDVKERLGGRMEIALDRCDGCGICVAECCGKAIEMQ